MKNYFATTLFFISSFISFGQSINIEKADKLILQAIEKMDSGYYQKSINILEEARSYNPDSYIYDYEIGYAHLLNKNYKASIKHLKKSTKYDHANDQCYQMLGNAYDISGNYKKALKTYNKGLKLFPNSGRLYLEKGVVYQIQKNYFEAMKSYEKGIEVEPNYPSNYFRAADIYLGSNNKVWGMIYGEIFMNLEPNTERTASMSSWLYNTYLSEIKITSDTSAKLSFASKDLNISLKSLKKDNGELLHSIQQTLNKSYYEMALGKSISNIDTINLETLNAIRSNFVDEYFDQGFYEKFPVVLFKYQRKIKGNGFIEPYNYWLLSEGNPDAFDKWLEKNGYLWDQFVEWYLANPIQINRGNMFLSGEFLD